MFLCEDARVGGQAWLNLAHALRVNEGGCYSDECGWPGAPVMKSYLEESSEFYQDSPLGLHKYFLEIEFLIGYK